MVGSPTPHEARIAPAPRAQQDVGPPQKRKRLPRATLACSMCRVRKVRCDQNKPKCGHCARFRLECAYQPLNRDGQRSDLNAYGVSGQTNAITNASGPDVASNNFSMLTARGSNQELISKPGHLPRASSAVEEVVAARTSLSGPGDHSSAPAQVFIADSLTNQHGNSSGRTDVVASDSVGEVNNYTTGIEFFGPSGTFPFLARLLMRSQVSRQHDMSTTLRHNRSVGEPQSVIPATSPANGEHLSIVNFLYNEDYPVLTRPQTPEQYPQPTGTGTQPAAIDVELQLTASNTKNGRAHPNHHSMPSEASQGFQAERQNTNSKSSHTHHSHSKPSTNVPLTSLECLSGRERKIQIEQECIRLYFSNLHLVHPILQKKSFLDRCESEVWSVSLASADKLPHKRHRSRFLALYNAVCAVGAITAGDETALGDTSINPLDSSYPSYSNDTRSKRRDKVTYLPVTLARVFLEQAKQNLGDVFEICSMDSTQALFLMSVFCQNALKPHSCYMYSGMAARTALAIGITNEKVSDSMANKRTASNTWWCIYSHEMEMCCAAGRDTFLKRPSHYNLPLPPVNPEIDSDNSPTAIIAAMVSFADILRKASKRLYHTKAEPLDLISKSALELDAELKQWKDQLPSILSLDVTSLQDPKWLNKQKVVLKLRFWYARIILHRQFLVASAVQGLEPFSVHVELCLDASRQTIHLLYNTYLQQYYFRTWWYNTTYTLYASMIILYLILLNYDNVPADALIQDVEKSLEILRSMGTVHVAHRCSQLISEVLEIAKAQIARRRQEAGAAPRPSASQSSAAAAASVNENLQPATGGNYQPELNSHETTAGVFGEEVLTSLIDFNLLGDFAGLGDMRAFFNSTNGAGSGPGQGIEGDLSSFGAQNDLHGGEDGVLFDISSDMELGLFGSLQGFVT